MEKLLTTTDAARYLGMSKSFLDNGRCHGDLPGRTPQPPFIRIGKAVRYDVRDLDEWIVAHKVSR